MGRRTKGNTIRRCFSGKVFVSQPLTPTCLRQAKAKKFTPRMLPVLTILMYLHPPLKGKRQVERRYNSRITSVNQRKSFSLLSFCKRGERINMTKLFLFSSRPSREINNKEKPLFSSSEYKNNPHFQQMEKEKEEYARGTQIGSGLQLWRWWTWCGRSLFYYFLHFFFFSLYPA